MISDSQMTFGDLTDSLKELQNNRNSPVSVRRAFARFLTLAQQLTETMRKEYKSHTGEDWEAVKFDKWDNTTKLFKKLRRSDYHEFPVVINVRESQYYIAEVLDDEEGNEYNGYIIPQVIWGLGDPFSEHIPQKNDFDSI
ncbi:MAG TPA: hypothetical protein VEB00_02420 [Clostridia bacterium]|nr:hypothetical protein [Clostridia bacterium]